MNKLFRRSYSDQDIVNGILEGGKAQERAIEALYEQNRSFLMKFLRNRSNQKNYVKEPEDILWESMEALVTNILDGHYVVQANKPLSGYLTTICKNLWHKFLHQEEHRQERQNIWLDETITDSIDVSQIIAEQERWNNYLTIFEQAGKNCKQILTLWLVDGLSGKEMADLLIAEGKFKSEQSIRNAKSDCMNKITSQLKNLKP
ncbi:MAG: hypothetical protein U0Y10_06915 [Spirosomataceae bacterium]